MGSLVSGWDSPVANSDSVKRCKSPTRDAIDAFWNTKKTNEEHVQDSSKLVAQEVAENREQKEKKVDDLYENQSTRGGWWRRTNLAFLNEVREVEGRPNKYVPQFKVADIAKVAR